MAHIQTLLPNARVLYCSATGVSDVKNMAFMERLGLWGDGAPFKSFDIFITTMQKKGLGPCLILRNLPSLKLFFYSEPNKCFVLCRYCRNDGHGNESYRHISVQRT